MSGPNVGEVLSKIKSGYASYIVEYQIVLFTVNFRVSL